MIVSTIAQGFLWAVLGLGIYLTFRILNFPDLTITSGVSPLSATLLGVGAGMLAGLMTGLLYTKGKIPIILSGILVMSALNSVMLFIMKSPNLSLLNQKKLFNSLDFLNLPPNYDKIIISLIVLVIVIGGILLFLYTDLGQAYVVTGDNEEMAKSFGINTDRMKILGLMISNGIIGLAGALIAQSEGYADVNKGIGVIVIGLASIILGEPLFGELTLSERLIAIVLGSVLYQLLILLVIKLKLDLLF